MELNWKRVNDINELKVGDIIRTNPEYFRRNAKVINEITYTSTSADIYHIRIHYDKIVIVDNNKIIYEDLHHETYMTFDRDLLCSYTDSNSWTEKLIIEEKDLRDEIDLLMGCIFE